MSEVLLRERQGDVLRLRLHRPERAHALNAPLVEALHAAVAEAEADAPRLLVLEGSEKVFCGGFDLSTLEAESSADLLERLVQIELLLQRIYHLPFPTAAFAAGSAIGAGADLFAACHYRIAAEGTKFRFPGWRFGIALGTRRLAQRIGHARALELLLEQRTVEAEAAVGTGLATEVCPLADWSGRIDALLRQTTKLAPRATSQLLELLTVDTREVDLNALRATGGAGDLKARLQEYLASAAQTKR